MTINIINEYAVNDNDDDNNGRISLQSVAMTIASELNNKCEIVPGKNRWGNQPSFLIIPNDPTQYYKIRIWSMTHPRTGEPYPTYNTILYGDGVAQHAERAVPSTYASATKTAKLMPKANKAMRITKKSDKSNKGILETANQNISEMLKKCMNIVDQYWSNSELKLDYSDPGSYVLQSLGQNKVSQICAKLANQFANSARLQMYYRTPGHYIEDLAKQNNLLEQSEVLEATGLKPETIKRYLEVARKQRDELKKHQKQSTEYRGIAKRMSDRREAGIERAEKRLSDIENRNVSEELNENLRAWFGKGKEGGAGGGGWDRYNTKGERIGKCGERKPGEGKPKCLSKQKAAQLRAKGGKKAIAAAVNKKRREDPNPTRRGAAKMVSNKTRSKKTNESLQESWKSIGFDLRSDVLWPALLFESVNPQKSTDFKAWINQQRESQKEPAIGSKCILAMLNHVGDIIMVFYGDAIYAGQNESYYMLKTSSGTHEYSKLNQLVFASEQDFEQFMLLLQMKFQDDNIKIDTQKLAVMETKTSKVVSENTDDFRRDLLARVKEKAAKMQADTAIARAKNPDLWKWNVGDEVKSNKTGKTYTIIYTSMSPKYGAMYGYMRGDKYSDDYEQGQFIAALAHKSLHRIGSQELDEEQLDELKCWPGYTRVKGVPAGAPGSCKKKIKEDVSKSDEFIWTDYEGVPIETRMIIAEAHFTNKNLFESNDSESSEYFLSLQSMSSPLKENNQYIISVLALINNNVVQLQPPEIITLLQKKSDSYLVRRNNGQKTEFPAKHLREEMVACSFFFNNSKAYDKFRNIMSLKYDLNLPNINLQGLSEHMNKRVCPHCSGPLVEFSQLNEKKDACYYKVKSRYKVWPSAYASGALVKCRKVGAKNWGNKSKTNESNDRERLWILYADDTAVAKYVSEKEAQRALLDLQDKYSSVKFKIVHQSEKDAIATNTKKMGDKHAKG